MASKASTKEFDAATGKASFDKVKESLLALSPESLLQPNVDLQSAALAAFVLVDRANQASRRAVFARLPAALFEASTVDRLETVANALVHIELEAIREGVASTGVKVDVALVQEGTELRTRMLKAADYNLGELNAVARELADIRLGSGYLDLANDLSRIAVVYAAHKGELATDKRYYDAADADLAVSLAKRIRDEFRSAATRSGLYSELRPRAFTELSRLYNEMRAAAQFLFRAEPAVLDEFPALRVAIAALRPTARRAKKAVENPAGAPANGGASGAAAGGSE